MSTILVTGGTGYVGSHTAVMLLEAGHEVIIVDNLANSSDTVVSRIEELGGKKIIFYQTDVRDVEALQQVFSRHYIDAVVHFAALKAVAESVANPLLYYNVNVGGTVALCEAMLKAEVSKLVYSSSATIYGVPKKVPLAEDDSESSMAVFNPYGRTKVICEALLRDICAADPSWSVALLRYFNPIGAHPSGLLGEDPVGVPNNIMPNLTRAAMGQITHFSVFGDDYPTEDGTPVRDYLHVQDLSEGHVKALDYLMNKTGIEAFNLGNGKGYSVLEVIAAFEQASGQVVPTKMEARRPGDVAISCADPSKAKTILGWQTKRSIGEMCADAWRWQQMNPHGYQR